MYCLHFTDRGTVVKHTNSQGFHQRDRTTDKQRKNYRDTQHTDEHVILLAESDLQLHSGNNENDLQP